MKFVAWGCVVLEIVLDGRRRSKSCKWTNAHKLTAAVITPCRESSYRRLHEFVSIDFINATTTWRKLHVRTPCSSLCGSNARDPPPPSNSLDAVIHMQVRLGNGPFVWCSSPFSHSPNTWRRFTLVENNVCLVGENLTCSVPALWVYCHTTTAMHDISTPNPPLNGPINYARSAGPAISCRGPGPANK